MDNKRKLEHRDVASVKLECEVCYEEYDSDNHKPLCVACGHTFCFSCISDLPYLSSCPKCKKKIKQSLGDMLVNYALIPSEDKPKRAPSSQPGAPCPLHQKAQDYVCVDCMELVCFRCFKLVHAKHSIELVDDLLRGDEAEDARAAVRTKICQKLGPVNDLLTWVDRIMNLNTDIGRLKDSLQAQKRTIEQDLESWDELSVTNMDENKRRKFLEILSHQKLTPGEITKLPVFKAELDAASKNCEAIMARHINQGRARLQPFFRGLFEPN
ncbi:tripartite motif-containing protein 75 [Hyalella azteca]|uniref:Tripartite motif-containing protein 75 n=1 Tax=Hyalella azteca TaxID=294128 RepID=A0A8B7NCH7_HYAAZ|nr:tripartite motif-containing protein 75 [Hyalella azteca]XP_018011247.1 tripartite motif-containing protein 75 [Hyalella azteca]